MRMERGISARSPAITDTLVELLGEAVRRFGPRTALSITPGFRPQRWTYQDLWDFSGRAASLLHQRGKDPKPCAVTLATACQNPANSR